MISTPVRRVATGILTLWLVAFAAWAGPVAADTGDGAPITINIVPAGALNVTWSNTPAAFLVDGEPPSLNASAPSVVATATFVLDVTDTRPDDTRDGYAIAISADPFSATDASTTISQASLTIVAITGLPDGYSAASAIGATLDLPVTVLTVPHGAGAVDATISFTIGMTITPGIMEGNYSGSITSSILPLSSNTP